jgi:hypothetical protein
MSPFRLSEFKEEILTRWILVVPQVPVMVHFMLKIDDLRGVGSVLSDQGGALDDLIEIETFGGADLDELLSDFYELVRNSGYYGADPDGEGVDEEEIYSQAEKKTRKTPTFGKAAYAVFITQVIAFQ